jgi:predicted nucleic acid-binding protein
MFITELLRHAQEYITTTDHVTQRAKLLTKGGIKAIDALHLALAEAYHVDYFCTCDDRFYRRAMSRTEIPIKLRMPLELAQEVIKRAFFVS